MSNVDLSQAIDAAQRDRDNAKVEALSHLQATDWMVVRSVETGTPLPANVAKSRRQARALLND